MNETIRAFSKTDFDAISVIYAEGISTGISTFETNVPDWPAWNNKYIESCRLVAEMDDVIVGYAVLSQVSKRDVYKGVAEVSVYISNTHQRKGIGEKLLLRLIDESEKHGFWTLQAGIFSENIASINLHEKCGFRVVGVREKIGKLNGRWYDNHFLERRSKSIN